MIKVYTAGTWDLFHVGHLNILRKSKMLGDILIVGVSTDDLVYNYKGKLPIFPLEHRLEIINSCKYVDQVIIQEKLLDINLIKLINPDIFTIGSDWKDKQISGIEFLKQQNKTVVYFEYTDFISSSIIKTKLK